MRIRGIYLLSAPARADRRARFAREWAATSESHRPVTPVTARTDLSTFTQNCIASHLSVWDHYPGPLLVFEDDAVFRPEFTLDLTPPPDWEILWLGGRPIGQITPINSTWYKVPKMFYSHALVIRKPQELAAKLRQIAPTAIDTDLSLLHNTRQYALTYPTVGQSSGQSDHSGRDRPEDLY